MSPYNIPSSSNAVQSTQLPSLLRINNVSKFINSNNYILIILHFIYFNYLLFQKELLIFVPPMMKLQKIQENGVKKKRKLRIKANKVGRSINLFKYELFNENSSYINQ